MNFLEFSTQCYNRKKIFLTTGGIIHYGRKSQGQKFSHTHGLHAVGNRLSADTFRRPQSKEESRHSWQYIIRKEHRADFREVIDEDTLCIHSSLQRRGSIPRIPQQERYTARRKRRRERHRPRTWPHV